MTQHRGQSGTTPEALEPAGHVRRYADVVGEGFELVRTLPGGRALEIVGSDGSRSVLKWDSVEESKQRRRVAIDAARRLGAEAGWPVPAFDLAEDSQWLYVRQDLMLGEEPTQLTRRLFEQVAELIDATEGLGSSSPSDWPDRLVDTLVAAPVDPTIYCSHEPLRQHSPTGRRLISRIEEIGAEALALEAANSGVGGADDLMHWDLHPGNLLVLDGNVSAVIDLDNAGPGRRGFDLVTFALSSQILPADDGLASALLDEARSRVSDELWIASIAHLVLRFSNWAMRTGHTEEAEHWIAEGGRQLLA